MHAPGWSKVLGVLAVFAAAAMWPGRAAIAHDSRGTNPQGSSIHIRDHDGDRDHDDFGDHRGLFDHGFHDDHHFDGDDRFLDGDARFFHDSPRWFLPPGSVVPVLPDAFSTYWFGDVPYYYAYGNYYVWQPDDDGYEVTTPPPDEQPAMAPPDRNSSLRVFAYPLKGQSQSQQARDHSQCRDWAVDQAGGDPTRATTRATKTVATARSAALREGYLRALSACLAGRGYSVK